MQLRTCGAENQAICRARQLCIPKRRDSNPSLRHAVHTTQIKFSKETMEAEKSTASNNFALAWFIKVRLLVSTGSMVAQFPLHPCIVDMAEACWCRRGGACRLMSAWRK